jgi:hypothetical protein
MEVITTIFDQLEEDIHTRLRVLEKQIVFMLAQNQRGNNGNTEAIDFLENKVHSMTNLVSTLEQRIRSLESRPVHVPTHVPLTPLAFNERSAGLEGLVIQPSPVLSAISVSNSVVLPTIQRTLVLNEEVEEVEVDVDEDAEKEMVAERQGGLTVEEEDEAEEEAEVEEEGEEENEDEEVEEEEEEEEAGEEELELEEFTWKGKAYYKDQNENVYRMVEEGVPEDEPFATYDPTNNKLTRIS